MGSQYLLILLCLKVLVTMTSMQTIIILGTQGIGWIIIFDNNDQATKMFLYLNVFGLIIFIKNFHLSVLWPGHLHQKV